MKYIIEEIMPAMFPQGRSLSNPKKEVPEQEFWDTMEEVIDADLFLTFKDEIKNYLSIEGNNISYGRKTFSIIAHNQ